MDYTQPQTNPNYFYEQDQFLQQQLEQERRRQQQLQAQQQQQQAGLLGNVAGGAAGQSMFGGATAPNTPQAVMTSATGTIAQPSAAPAVAQYSPVPSLTESNLGFGAGAPQGPAIGSSSNGGFMTGAPPAEGGGFFSGAANTFGSGLQAGGEALAPYMTYAGPAAIAGIGAYTGAKGVEAWENAKGRGGWDGLKAGLNAAGPLKFVPILGQLPAAAGLIRGLTSKPLHEDERRRRGGRGDLNSLGIYDKNHNYIDADGNIVDMDRATELGGGKSYNIDWNAVSGDAGFNEDVGALNAFTSGSIDGRSKLSSDLAGELANYGRATGSTRGVVSNVKNRIDQKAAQLGVDPWETQYLHTNKMVKEGKLSRDEADARLNELDFQYKKNAYAKGGKAYGAKSSNPSGEIRKPKGK